MDIESQYIKCSACGKWYSHGKVISYSVFGKSECWSDGKCMDGNMSEYSFMPFSKCDSCSSFFWFEDCQKFPEYELREYLNKKNRKEKNELIEDFLTKHPGYLNESSYNFSLNYPYAHYWDNLPEYFIKDYLCLLEQADSLNDEREIYVRTKLWQHINDLVRDFMNPVFYHFKYCFRFKSLFDYSQARDYNKLRKKNKELYITKEKLKYENLKRLVQLLESKEELYEDDVCILIEAYRVLGDFTKAKSKLLELKKAIEPDSNGFIDKFNRQLRSKSKAAFKL